MVLCFFYIVYWFFRSHAVLLAAMPAVGLAAILYFAGAPWPLVAAVPALAFASALPLLLRVYRRRAD